MKEKIIITCILLSCALLGGILNNLYMVYRVEKELCGAKFGTKELFEYCNNK